MARQPLRLRPKQPSDAAANAPPQKPPRAPSPARVPTQPSAPKRSWLRAQTIVPAFALLVLLLILLLPKENAKDRRLTTYSTSSKGAQGTYESLTRLGYRVARTNDAYPDTLATAPIYVLLSPVHALTQAEQDKLLLAVRRGAGLVIADESGQGILDTLGLKPRWWFGQDESMLHKVQLTTGTTDWGDLSDSAAAHARRANAGMTFNAFALGTIMYDSAKVSEGPSFLWLQDADIRRFPLLTGHALGAGTIVVCYSPWLFRNEIARHGPPIVGLVRALDWMGGKTRPIVFDEYHQGFGVHMDIPGAIWRALTETRLGNVALQLLIAGGVLLLALSVRALVPQSEPKIQRRSPLEHATALAHAYLQQVSSQSSADGDAITFGIDQLIGGLRRRHPFGTPRSMPHAEYLTVLDTHFPATREHVAALRGMLATPPPHLADAAHHVATIERALSVPV